MHLQLIKSPGTWTLPALLCVVAFLISGTACKSSSVNGNGNKNASNANSSVGADATSSTPPFPTKEPERYQATMVTSGTLGGQAGNIPGLASLTNQQMSVARDGDKRRVDTEMLPGVKIVYLQLSGGRYILYPAKKIYAEIKMDGSDTTSNSATGVPSDFSPGKLINETAAGAKYEKLGTEEVNGRMTTKYRVTTGGGDSSQASSETIVWADESLGMPIKVESTSKDGSKFTMEMRDIKQDVDAKLFELPKDYQKVEHSDLLSKVIPSLPDIFGNDKEDKKGKKR